MEHPARRQLLFLASAFLVAIPIAVIAESVEVRRIHQQFYAAIASATPILLLALLVLVRREAAISFATRQESIVTEARIEALKEETIKMIENARELVEAEPGDDDAPLEPVDPERDPVRADRRNHIISGLENAEDRITRMQETFEQLPPERVGWKELAVTMGIAVGAAIVSESASLTALGSGCSNFVLFFCSAAGLGALFLLLLLMEIAALRWNLDRGPPSNF